MSPAEHARRLAVALAAGILLAAILYVLAPSV